MKKIKAIIVEDHSDEAKALQKKINSLLPQVELLDICDTIAKAKVAIEDMQPQLLFLDIDIGSESAFDLLKQLNYKSFKIIFTTAHDDKILNAIRVSAVDYLQKPYFDEDLLEAVQRAISLLEKENPEDVTGIIERLVGNIKHTDKQAKIFSIINIDGEHILKLNEIIFCSTIKLITDENTQGRIIFRLINRPGIIVSNKTIKGYDEILSDNDFFKVSANAIVNMNHILVFKRKSSDLIMKGYISETGKMTEEEIGISDKYKEAFLIAYNRFSKRL